jgi:hypothetical protein
MTVVASRPLEIIRNGLTIEHSRPPPLRAWLAPGAAATVMATERMVAMIAVVFIFA